MIRARKPWASAGHQVARTFILIYLPLSAIFIFLARDTYFVRPMFEIGDFAAGALQIEKAKHLSELLGNYSRFGFHHPGPAFFYVYALGDIVFRDLFQLTPAPLNAYLLAGVLLQTAFLSVALAILAELADGDRGVFILCALAIALVFAELIGNPAFQLWPPYQPVLPFVCLLAAAIAVALGWAAMLPILVLCGSFLVHGHVAQPLFVLPISAAAYLSLFIIGRQGPGLGFVRFMKATARPHVWTLAVAIPFALPLLIDAIRGPQSNLAIILGFISEGAPTSTWGAAVFYFLSFLALRGHGNGTTLDVAPTDRIAFLTTSWPALVGWLVILIVPTMLLLRWDRSADATFSRVGDSPVYSRRLVATYCGFLALGALLTLLWAKVQYGPPYAFNGFFFNGLLYLAALPLAFVAARIRVLASRPVLAGAVVLLLAVALSRPSPFANVTTLGAEPGDDSARQLHLSVARLLAELSEPPSAVLLEFPQQDWPQAVGVALVLQRNGVSYLVDSEWGFMFGYDHVYTASASVAGDEAVFRWSLAAPSPQASDQVILSEHIALVSSGRVEPPHE